MEAVPFCRKLISNPTSQRAPIPGQTRSATHAPRFTTAKLKLLEEILTCSLNLVRFPFLNDEGQLWGGLIAQSLCAPPVDKR